MNPSRPEVVSGVSRSDGSAARICAAIRAALTSVPFAQPVCVSTPWIVSVTLEPVNVSSCSSPMSEPSSVYAHAAPKRAMSKSRAPSPPVSSSGVKPTRSVGRGSSGCAARCATAAMISATPALSSAPSSVSPLEVTMSCPVLAASSGSSAGSSTVPPRGSRSTPPS